MTADLSRVRPAAPRTDRTLAALIFTTLYCLYLLTFNGVFRSIDELALYAMTESVVQRGDLSTPQVLFAKYHNAVGTLEPGQPLATAPLYALAQAFPEVNNLQVVMLIAPFATALTAAVLYLIGRQLNYDQGRAIAVALVFGVATLAWPYARTFLREPLAGLILTLAFYMLLRNRRDGQACWIIAMLAVLLIAILVKFINFVAAPFFLIPAALDWLHHHPQHKRRIVILAVAGIALIAAAGVYLAATRYLLASPIDYLASLSLDRVWTALYGMLFSPGKGLIFYMPVIVAAWFGILRARQQRSLFIWTAVLAPLAIILVYSSTGQWYGGQTWGPRFLVPMLPLMIFPLIEIIQRRSVWVLIAISCVLQLGPITADWAIGHRPLNRLQRPFETTVGLDPAYWYLSPPFNQLRFWSADRVDLLWAHPMAESEPVFDPILPLGLIAIMGMSMGLLRRSTQTASRTAQWSWPLLVIAATALLLWRGWFDAPDAPGLSMEEARAVARPLQAVGATHAFITVSNEFHVYPLMGLMKGRFQHFWYSPLEHTNFNELAAITDVDDRMTLSIDRGHLPADQSGNELRDWLNHRAYLASGEFVGGYERFGYVQGPTSMVSKSIAVTFSELLTVSKAGIGGESFAAGGIIPLHLELTKRAALPEIVVVATQLAGENGVIIGGFNSAIESGTLDIAAWPIGSSVIDRRGFPIPADIPAGTYRLEIGFETLAGNLISADGKTYIPIGQVQIAR